jgi:hypothetical protein
MYVSYNGVTSTVQEIACAVSQGSVLGTLLFLIFMNYLPFCLTDTNAILFADDTTLYAAHEDINWLYDIIN